MARDPSRIDILLAELKVYWKRHPDLRLCQIIGNFLTEEYPPGEYEDVVMDSRGYCTEDFKFLEYLLEQKVH
jgi:uncharacterized protein YihD (DUF1040 family)